MNSTATGTFLKAGLTAGILDIVAALVINVGLRGQTTVTKLLQSIAGGILGKSSYEGGFATAALGLLLHFVIAFIFTLLYILIYPKLDITKKQPLLAGVVYGLFVWSIMNLVVLPIAFSRPVKWDTLLANNWVGILVIVFCVGIPIALITNREMKEIKTV